MAHGYNASHKENNRNKCFAKHNKYWMYERSNKPGFNKWFKRLSHKIDRKDKLENIE